jgi:hypothetical protein
MPDDSRRVVRVAIPVESDDDLRALRAALLAARASELAEMRRRGDRLSWGYGDEGARESMSSAKDDRERRWQMLDRLIAALEQPPPEE